MAAPVTRIQLMNALTGLTYVNLLFVSVIFARLAWDGRHPNNTSLDPECALIARNVSLCQSWSAISFLSSNVIALAFATKQVVVGRIGRKALWVGLSLSGFLSFVGVVLVTLDLLGTLACWKKWTA